MCLGKGLADYLAEVWIQSCRQWGALKVLAVGAVPLVLGFHCGVGAVWRRDGGGKFGSWDRGKSSLNGSVHACLEGHLEEQVRSESPGVKAFRFGIYWVCWVRVEAGAEVGSSSEWE